MPLKGEDDDGGRIAPPPRIAESATTAAKPPPLPLPAPREANECVCCGGKPAPTSGNWGRLPCGCNLSWFCSRCSCCCCWGCIKFDDCCCCCALAAAASRALNCERASLMLAVCLVFWQILIKQKSENKLCYSKRRSMKMNNDTLEKYSIMFNSGS